MAAGDGLISMTPTSIAYSGTSASINADGGVDFSAVTSLSLNGVFTGDYDNYLIVLRSVSSVNETILLRMRASGTDATGSDYAHQVLIANGTSAGGERQTSQTSVRVGSVSSEQRSGDNIHVYGPALAQPTAFRNVNARGSTGAAIIDAAGTHSLSTAYDGCTLFLAANNFSGQLHVFGYEE